MKIYQNMLGRGIECNTSLRVQNHDHSAYVSCISREELQYIDGGALKLRL